MILVLIAIIVVLISRWRQHKRRRRQQSACVSASDDTTFQPYVVDDAATDKLSCGDRMRENLCQVSCASNGSVSPHRTTSPKRPASYALSTLDSAMPASPANNMMRSHEYGSNADELQNAGGGAGQPDGVPLSPQFVGRSPAVTAKRTVPPPPSLDSTETAKGLNNLNKAENYRKKST